MEKLEMCYINNILSKIKQLLSDAQMYIMDTDLLPVEKKLSGI